jgi:disulfide bond formation protein DsbB
MADGSAAPDRSLDPLRLARLLSLVVPAALLAGAFAFEYLGGLPPCEMCWWQRWAHMAAIAFAGAAFAAGRLPDRGRSFVWLAALSILTSGLIGFYHAGVEADLFEGFTQCTATGSRSLADIMATPLVRCDEVPWQLFGVSMAGWNAILSALSALLILWLSLKPSRTRS